MPATVEPTQLGESANAEEDWTEAGDEGAVHSANHLRRGEKTEFDRQPGRKTRTATKDAISRRL